ncbi:alpha/beta-hydrolase [Neolentinus lepideus HHB14362 ss-1]|uniref:Alpha/beta-hydrolase n=1 Tax=Neolentinus lepideus HHB14362 ss-1 TaxID=1314782 RepID=A0A165T649_9AGAM|nr:alpha/beta-hydrolase [Neolentinus lepideus HHB14362 ss-1]
MAPLYTYQPSRSLYVAYFGLSLLIKFPAWCIYYIQRRNRQRPSWTLKRCLIISVAQSLSAFPVKLNFRQKIDPSAKYKDAQFAWMEPVRDDLVRGQLKFYAKDPGVVPARVSGYWLFKPAREDEKTVLHFRVGAFTTGSANPNFMTSNITRGLLEHSRSLMRTFGVEYRLSSLSPNPPENLFPATVLDALAGYRSLIEDMRFQPRNVIIAGDSAGGHIVEVLIRYLVDNAIPSLPPPGHLLSVSTTLDLSASRNGSGTSQERNAVCDIFAPKKSWEQIVKHSTDSILGPISRELAKTDPFLSPSSPYVQPATGLFNVAGGSERLCDDSELLTQKMAADGIEVITDIPSDAVHDFLCFAWHEPERTQTLIRISHWVDSP